MIQTDKNENRELRLRLERLQDELDQSQSVIQAIQRGEVDALVVSEGSGEQIYTLQGAEHPYRMLVEAMNEGAVMLDLQGTVLYSNHCFAEIIGLPLECVIGSNFLNLLNPENGSIFNALLEGSRSGNSRGEVQISQGGDRMLPAYLSLSTLRVYDVPTICMVITDLTGQKQSEQIAAAERLSNSILDQAGEAIIVCDERGRIIRISRAVLDLCESNPIGSRFDQAFLLFSESEPKISLTLSQILSSNKIMRQEVLMSGREGKQFHLLLSVSKLKRRQKKASCVITLSDITERKNFEMALRRSEEHYRLMALHDSLTGLANRVRLEDRLIQSIILAKHHGDLVAILFLDIDRFKQVNDTLGHSVGDLVLQEFSRRLSLAVGEENTVARLSGDEFIAILSGIKSVREAVRLAEEILDVLRPAFVIKGEEVLVRCSIGMAFYPEDGSDADSLLKRADAALYHAKELGRDTLHLYTKEMQVESKARLDMENGLRIALEQEQFSVYFQPVLRAEDQKVVTTEALVRWHHPKYGMILPGDFIPLAEDTGLILAIGAWVLRTACLQTKAWHDAGHTGLGTAVNLSARQFLQPKLVEMIKLTLESTGLAPEFLELEITETMAMRDVSLTTDVLMELIQLGVRISIDDFGTGHSSLNYLKRFPLSTLKINQTFVAHCVEDRQDAAIVKAVVTLAHNLGLSVIAEGIESEDQAEYLSTLGCDLFQGHLYCKAIPAEECGRFLHAMAT